jgi:hypothetical protein
VVSVEYYRSDGVCGVCSVWQGRIECVEYVGYYRAEWDLLSMWYVTGLTGVCEV